MVSRGSFLPWQCPWSGDIPSWSPTSQLPITCYRPIKPSPSQGQLTCKAQALMPDDKRPLWCLGIAPWSTALKESEACSRPLSC